MRKFKRDVITLSYDFNKQYSRVPVKMTRIKLLEKWMNDIRKKEKYYCFDGWKYRISGTVLELYILPSITKDLNKYRCSTITIGQILKTLSSHIENEGLHFHIQSFPNLENPEIVASIRMDDNSYHNPDVFTKNENRNNADNFREWLFKMSHRYQFRLQPIEKPEKFNIGFQSEKKPEWLALSSSADNPFAWLNLGYWKETILSEANKIFPETELFVHDFCKYRENSKGKKQTNNPQAYIAFTH